MKEYRVVGRSSIVVRAASNLSWALPLSVTDDIPSPLSRFVPLCILSLGIFVHCIRIVNIRDSIYKLLSTERRRTATSTEERAATSADRSATL